MWITIPLMTKIIVVMERVTQPTSNEADYILNGTTGTLFLGGVPIYD